MKGFLWAILALFLTGGGIARLIAATKTVDDTYFLILNLVVGALMSWGAWASWKSFARSGRPDTEAPGATEKPARDRT